MQGYRVWRLRQEPARRALPVSILATIARGGRHRHRFKGFHLSSPHIALGATTPSTLELELAQLFVDALNLETPAASIDPQAPLFGDGLGLDSIDILEVALEISQRYGFQLRSDDENNQRIFESMRSLAAHVAQHRTK